MTTHIQVVNEHGEYDTTEIDEYQAETLYKLVEQLDPSVPQNKRLIAFFKGLDFHIKQEVKQLSIDLKNLNTLYRNVTFRPENSDD